MTCLSRGRPGTFSVCTGVHFLLATGYRLTVLQSRAKQQNSWHSLVVMKLESCLYIAPLSMRLIARTLTTEHPLVLSQAKETKNSTHNVFREVANFLAVVAAAFLWAGCVVSASFSEEGDPDNLRHIHDLEPFSNGTRVGNSNGLSRVYPAANDVAYIGRLG